MGTKTKRTIQDLLNENRRLRQLCDRDFLTGLFNRRKLIEDLERYSELNKRYKIKFSLLMLDIDKFKEINDTRGHKIGDKVLKEVAYILQKNIRKIDKCYRLGGDEFIIIFSHHKTEIFIRRIKELLKELNLSVSIGYCDISKHCLEIVDKLMY